MLGMESKRLCQDADCVVIVGTLRVLETEGRSAAQPRPLGLISVMRMVAGEGEYGFSPGYGH